MEPGESQTPGVKTFKLLWQCITELDLFLKKPENNFYYFYFQTTAVGFEDPGFFNYGPSPLFYLEARFTLLASCITDPALYFTLLEGPSFLVNFDAPLGF